MRLYTVHLLPTEPVTVPTATSIADDTASAVSAATIRPFAAGDAEAVAQLLVRMFQGSDRPAPPGMAAYLRRVYLDAPWHDPEIASRVALDGTGRIVGFAGVIAQPMLLDGRPIRAAFTSSLAVDDRTRDPTIAARLVRDVQNGPQEATLSDRANAASTSLSRALRAEVATAYSFDWLRVLRPAGLAVAAAALKLRPLRLLAPLVGPLDTALLARSLKSDEPHWTTPGAARRPATTDRAAGLDELLDLIPEFLAHFPLRPGWSREELALILTDAASKRNVGGPVSRVVLAPNGTPVGLYLYHVRKGHVAVVTQILASRGREGAVIDSAILHAASMGAVAIRGRAHPALTPALMERRAVFLPELSTLIHARDPDVLAHFERGTAFFTGLAGEQWMRLNGDRF